MFCQNRSEVPLSIDYLTYVISMISNALNTKVVSTISIVIQNTKRIFSLDFPGLLCLIPLYVTKIFDILQYNMINKHKNSLDESKIDYEFSHITINAAVSILASIIAIPGHYKNYEFPLLATEAKIFTMDNLNQDIYCSIIFLLSNFRVNEDTIKILCKSIACGILILYKESCKKVIDIDFTKVVYLII